MDTSHLGRLADAQLIETAHSLAARERTATADLIATLAEVDARRLYLGLGHGSMFAFCTARLRLSESAAYARIEAARIAVRFPLVLDLLLDGSINLTTVSLLAPHLTNENHDAILRAAIHKNKREVEMQVATLRPLPAVAAAVRKMPQPRAFPSALIAVDPSSTQEPTGHPLMSAAPRVTADAHTVTPAAHPVTPAAHSVTPADYPVTPAAHPPKRALVVPLSPERYKLQVTISRETHDKLRRAQDLLRHSVPNGDVALILDRALTVLVEKLEKQKGALSPSRISKKAGPASKKAAPTLESAPAPLSTKTIPRRERSDRSRHVPAAVRRVVWARDGGQCAFTGRDGRCPERARLEFHHVVPYADGGATNASNLELRCRAHNQYEAELTFGPWKLRESSIGYSPDPNWVQTQLNMRRATCVT